MEQRLPRSMPFSETVQELTRHALERMLDHPEFRTAFAHMLALLRRMICCTPDQYRPIFTTASSVAQVLTTVSYLSAELEEICDAYALGMQHLGVLVERSESEVYFIWEPFLHEFLTIGLYHRLGVEIPVSWGWHIFHLESGNPIERKSNGDDSHLEDATPAYRQTLEQYLFSLQPPPTPGRLLGSNAMPRNFIPRVCDTYKTLCHAPDAKVPVTEEDVANAMHIPLRSFQRYRRRTGLTWKQFKEKFQL
jgi:hypothetical protein